LVTLRGDDFPIMRKWYLLLPKDMVQTEAVRMISDFITAQKGRFLPSLPV
jgi:hypothetical protein